MTTTTHPDPDGGAWECTRSRGCCYRNGDPDFCAKQITDWDHYEATHPMPPPPTAYQQAATELRRLADILDTLPPLPDYTPQLDLWLTPGELYRTRSGEISDETASEAVDALAAAVIDTPAQLDPSSIGHFRKYGAKRTTGPVTVQVLTYVTNPDDPAALRAEITRLRGELAATHPTRATDPGGVS